MKMRISEADQKRIENIVLDKIKDGFKSLPGFSSINGAVSSIDFPKNKMVIVKAFDMFYPVIIKGFQDEIAVGTITAYMRKNGQTSIVPYNKDIKIPILPLELKGRTNGQKHWNDNLLRLLAKKTPIDFYIFNRESSTEPKILSYNNYSDTYSNFGVLLAIYFSPDTVFSQFQTRGMWDFFSRNITWGFWKLMRDTNAEKINPFYGFIVKDNRKIFYKSNFFWDSVSFYI